LELRKPDLKQNRDMNNQRVTLIGLGIMGSRMAKNLLKNGVQLTVYNRSPEPVQVLEAQGARAATSYREAVQDADIIISMLARPEVVREVVLDHCLADMKKGALWIDCSTVNPSFSREAARRAADHGLRFMDAPVAGTLPQAEKAELVFFVGGSDGAFESVHPLLQCMGKKVLHIGETGRGSAFKMLVNTLLAQSMAAFSETLLLGEKMGLDRDFLLTTLPSLPVSAPFLQAKANMIRSNNYDVLFPLELMHKDLHLASLSAYEIGQPLLLTNLTKELFANAKASGLGRKDFAAIHSYLQGEAG
jgi:3-hydroxyisobutyrate dehydrogenase-like beta-hydroxyacid dehydrogenase